MEETKQIGLRLHSYITDQGLNKKQFADRVGEDHGFLTRMLEGQDVSTKFLAHLPTAFPDLNLQWLFTGQGTMVVGKPKRNLSMEAELGELEETFASLTDTKDVISDAAKAKRFTLLLPQLEKAVGFIAKAQARRLDGQTALLQIIAPKVERP